MTKVARAKENPTTLQDLLFTKVTTACKRWIEGSIKEHASYDFYTGFQIKFFVAQDFIDQLDLLAGKEGTYDRPLVENGVVIGSWTLTPRNGRWSEMLIVHLEDRYYEKAWIVTHLASLAPTGFTRTPKVKYCRGNDGVTHCGLPLSYRGQKAKETTQCERCWHIDDKKQPHDLVF